MWKKIKSLLGKSPADAVGADTDAAAVGTVAVKKDKKFDMFARVLAVLAAVLMWFYVVNTTTVSEEREFPLVPVVCNGEENLRSEHGLVVQSISIDTLNVNLMGNRQTVRAVTNQQVKAYVSLSGIEKAGEYELAVYVDVPSGITLVSQTVSKVVVVVDQVSTKRLPVTVENLSLRGWSLSEGCVFGEISLNLEALTLEGPTLALRKVKSVELRTDVVGTADGNFKVSATPYLLDNDGNVIYDASLTIREEGKIEASVEVLKSKTVPLSVQGMHGYLSPDQVKIIPANVIITGDPTAVDATKLLLVAMVDETALQATEERTFSLNVSGLQVTDAEGNPVESVQVVFDLSKLPTRTVKNVPVHRGEEIVGYVDLTLRGVNGDVAALLQAISVKDVEVFADAEKPEGDLTAMTAVFTEFYRGSIYVTALSNYRSAPANSAEETLSNEIITP